MDLGDMTQGKGMAPFHAMALVKQAAQAKNLDRRNVNMKWCPPNCQMAFH